MKIAVISDLHYSRQKNLGCPERLGERAPELLARALQRLWEGGRPDVLLLGGDLVNDPDDDALLAELSDILNTAECPRIVIPGNHDPAPEVFYRYFPRPAAWQDIGGMRFLAFPDDAQTAGYNAFRSAEALETMVRAGKDSPFPLILFQHVPLFRRGTVACPYNYDNADEILEVAAKNGAVLSVSGHFHTGYIPSFCSPVASVSAPSLCDRRFSFLVLELNGGGSLASCAFEYLGE
ncbi:MAG: Calcineurin-like phosphoesterase superfamily domain protein [Lentisphaerae bacterium ADurb.Bin242]|nr:MAG: Calcineurin-like phosphoesterase superfamily domain protein [Lentisphaerae bacterium ADurb.Bin242]